MQQISTNKLSGRKHVEIDGHYYIVRKMGAGDQLTLSQCMRELDFLAKKENSKTGLTEEDNSRLAEIERISLDLTVRCFDDQEDGTKAKKLIESLTPDEITEIMDRIFNGPEVS